MELIPQAHYLWVVKGFFFVNSKTQKVLFIHAVKRLDYCLYLTVRYTFIVLKMRYTGIS